jgi:hypothetical protein
LTLAASTLLPEIADDLNGYNDYETETDSFLGRCLGYAVSDLWRFRNWSFKIGQDSITTTDGTKEYTPPSDFDGFIQSERFDLGYVYIPRYNVDNPIPDTTEGIRRDVFWRRYDNKLVFVLNPGADTYTLNYRKSVPTIADLSGIDDKPWVHKYLSAQTGFHALSVDGETTEQAAKFRQIAEDEAAREWNYLRAGQRRQRSRTVLSPHGYALNTGLRGVR